MNARFNGSMFCAYNVYSISISVINEILVVRVSFTNKFKTVFSFLSSLSLESFYCFLLSIKEVLKKRKIKKKSAWRIRHSKDLIKSKRDSERQQAIYQTTLHEWITELRLGWMAKKTVTKL